MLQQFLYRICDNEAAGSSGSERIPTTGDVTHDVATRSVPTHPMRQVGQRPLSVTFCCDFEQDDRPLPELRTLPIGLCGVCSPATQGDVPPEEMP